MEAASAGHCGVAKILLEFGAGINTHSNEFKVDTVNLYRIFRVKASTIQKTRKLLNVDLLIRLIA